MFQIGVVGPDGADFSSGAVTAMVPLTVLQADILARRHEGWRRNAVMPRQVDVAAAIGVSRNVVYYQLNRLEQKGYVRRVPGTRALQLLPLVTGATSDVDAT